MLTAAEKQQIVAALKTWAETAPDEPTIGFLGDGDLLRPSEIVTAVESGTADGESILEIPRARSAPGGNRQGRQPLRFDGHRT